MIVWQADFYKCSLTHQDREILWELLICDPQGNFIHQAHCPQSQANSNWLVSQLQVASRSVTPNIIQVFRPQSIGLLKAAGEKLGIVIEETRHTEALKQLLKQQQVAIAIDKPPPQSLPDNLWGEGWRFSTIVGGNLVEFSNTYPIPILSVPEAFNPLKLGLASNLAIPGMIIYGGRRSLILARWLEEVKPFSVNYIPTEVGYSGGLVLEAGLVERWILVTFEDTEVAEAGQQFERRKIASQGLHFLLVQPDDSGITYTGFWLLKGSG